MSRFSLHLGHSRSRSASGMNSITGGAVPDAQTPSPLPQTRETRAPTRTQSFIPFSKLTAKDGMNSKSMPSIPKAAPKLLAELPKLPSSAFLPSVEGYLVKRGSFIKSWKKRFFKLKHTKLYYYENSGDQKEKGTIDLNQVTSIEPIKDEKLASALGVPGLLFAFCINTPQRTYVLQANSFKEVEYWVQGLLAHRLFLDNTPNSKNTNLLTSISPSSSGVMEDNAAVVQEEDFRNILKVEEKSYENLAKELEQTQKNHLIIQGELRHLLERLGNEEDEEMKLLLLLIKTKNNDAMNTNQIQATTTAAKQSTQMIKITEELIRLKTDRLKELEAQISNFLDLQSFTEVKLDKIKTQQTRLTNSFLKDS